MQIENSVILAASGLSFFPVFGLLNKESLHIMSSISRLNEKNWVIFRENRSQMQVNCTYSIWVRRRKVYLYPVIEKDRDKFETIESKTLRHKEKQQCPLQEKHSSCWRTSTFASFSIKFICFFQFRIHVSSHLLGVTVNGMTALSRNRLKSLSNLK